MSTTILPTNAGLLYSPYNWVNGATNCTGAYLKTIVSGTTSVVLNLNTSMSPNAAKIRTLIDGTTHVDYTIDGLSSISLSTTLSSTASHLIEAYYLSRNTAIDSWTGPQELWKLAGLTLDTGGSVTAPSVTGQYDLVLGDSRIEAISAIAAGVQDSTWAEWNYIREVFRSEVGNVAYSGLGWCWPGATNVPPLCTPGNDSLTSWNKNWSGQSRLVGGLLSPQPNRVWILNMGGNDAGNGISNAQVTASVQACLAQIRAAAPLAQLIVGPSYDGRAASGVLAGVQAYQLTDPNCIWLDPQLTTAEQTAVNGISINELSYDGRHQTAQCKSLWMARNLKAYYAATGGSGRGGRGILSGGAM